MEVIEAGTDVRMISSDKVLSIVSHACEMYAYTSYCLVISGSKLEWLTAGPYCTMVDALKFVDIVEREAWQRDVALLIERKMYDVDGEEVKPLVYVVTAPKDVVE